MKKLLSLLLALTMLILPCAFAESAEDAENTEATEEIEVQLVEDAIAGLRYNLPADWIVLSAAAIESTLAASMDVATETGVFRGTPRANRHAGAERIERERVCRYAVQRQYFGQPGFGYDHANAV